MLAQGSQFVRQFVGATLAIIYWGLLFWRTLRRNRGNLVIEWGVVTIIVFLTMAFLLTIVKLPGWALATLWVTLFLLCLATLFFFFREVFQSLRKRMTKRRKAAES